MKKLIRVMSVLLLVMGPGIAAASTCVDTYVCGVGSIGGIPITGCAWVRTCTNN